MGASSMWILGKHIFPNMLGPVAVQATYILARAIIVDASLSFLGLGVPPPAPTWGNMLGDSRLFLGQAPALVIAPGLAISATTIAVNILGDWLRDRMDDRL